MPDSRCAVADRYFQLSAEAVADFAGVGRDVCVVSRIFSNPPQVVLNADFSPADVRHVGHGRSLHSRRVSNPAAGLDNARAVVSDCTTEVRHEVGGNASRLPGDCAAAAAGVDPSPPNGMANPPRAGQP